MRDITTTVFTFDELSETAKDKAVEIIREKLDGPWWDSSDLEDVADTVHLEFATAIGTPKADEYGPGDFPGIDDVTLEAWDTDHLEVTFRGILTRDNAPALPWVDGLDVVCLRSGRNHTMVDPLNSDEEAEPSQIGHIEMIDTVRSALDTAIRAGRDEVEHKTSEETARQWCEDNESQEYLEDGRLAD